MTVISISLPPREVLLPIAERFGLRLIVLFGSVARGRANSESDIDLGVFVDRPLTVNKRLKLWSALSSLFSVDVDLTGLNHVDPVLAFEAARDGKALFEGEPYFWDKMEILCLSPVLGYRKISWRFKKVYCSESAGDDPCLR